MQSKHGPCRHTQLCHRTHLTPGPQLGYAGVAQIKDTLERERNKACRDHTRALLPEASTPPPGARPTLSCGPLARPVVCCGPPAASLQRPRCPLPGPARSPSRRRLRPPHPEGKEVPGRRRRRKSRTKLLRRAWRPRAAAKGRGNRRRRAAGPRRFRVPVRTAGPGWKLRPSQRFRARQSGADGCGSREALVAASDPAHSPAVLSEAEACSGRVCAGDTVETLPFLERLKQL